MRERTIKEMHSDDDPEVVPPFLKERIKLCRIVEENGMVVYTGSVLGVDDSSNKPAG